MFSQGLKDDFQMLLMLLFRLGIDQDVVNENNDKLIQEIHKNLIHEIHEISGGIG